MSPLGSGGMATVYLAVLNRTHGFQKKCAIKLLGPSSGKDKMRRDALINEAVVGGQLRHPNLVETYDFGEVDGQWFIAMEFIDGWTLDDFLRRVLEPGGMLPPSVTLDILWQLCKGLAHAHGLKDSEGKPLNLVHRDLKPQNIMITPGGQVKLLDFGIVKSSQNQSQTMDGQTKGTPNHMAPEQVTGGDLDGRTDIFALGAVLYRMMTREEDLFAGDTLFKVMMDVLQGDTSVRVEQFRADFPHLTEILARCVEKDPDDRFASAEAMGKHIRELVGFMVKGPTLEAWLTDEPDEYDVLEAMSAARVVAVSGSDCTSDSKIAAHADSVPVWAVEEDELEVSQPQSAALMGQTRQFPSPKRKRRRRKKSKLGLKVAVPLAGAAILMLGVWLSLRTTDEPVKVAEAKDVPELTLTPAPTPSEIAETLMITTSDPTPEPVRRVTPKRRPTPKAVKVVEPEKVEYGMVTLGSSPWSTVFIDGTEVGRSPIIKRELPVGEHVVKFVCGACEGERTITIVVEADKVTTNASTTF
ncbi:MAG TPA: serine/threonine-protein kinase [Patescibacteria group bacterium]|nr:serine/threonine-protein kinase [Patescibacteria group bacterium]